MVNVVTPHKNTRRISYFLVKRIIDIIGSIFILILLSPMYLLIVLIIYFHSGRPILYPWKIIGFKGKPLTSWKFRTMVLDADTHKQGLINKNEMRGPVFKIKNDPRITQEGKLFRKYSMDESIQLISILKGDMSLVGPRPPLQTEWKNFNDEYKQKVSVKPGLTGLWQVSGRNRINDFDDIIAVDKNYIENWTLWLDIKILFKTIPAVFRGTGY